MRDPTDLQGQERDAEVEMTDAQAQRMQQVEDIKWLVGHASGRRIATRLLDRAGVYRTSFNPSGSVMAYNEGKRDMGLFLLAELMEAAPESYMKMLKEFAK